MNRIAPLHPIPLSLADVFRSAFGYASGAFDSATGVPVGSDYNFSKVPNKKDGTRKEYADLGSPYYSVNDLGREYYMPVMLDDYELPHPVISIDGHKNIIRTPLTRRRGSFKQEINIDDYQIVIRGVILSKNREYPEQIVQDLRGLFEKKGGLTIRSPITDVFLVTPDRQGFDQVIIEDIKFPPTVGIMNARAYELRMWSDEPFNLIEKDK